MKSFSALRIAYIILCAALVNPADGAVLKAKPVKVWVKKNFTGGVQCMDEYIFSQQPDRNSRLNKSEPVRKPSPKTPASAEDAFKEAGIEVFDKKDHHLPVCAACGCPAYSIDKLFLIKSADIEKARAIGYAPDDIMLSLTYQERQCYRDNGLAPDRVKAELAQNGIRFQAGDEEKPEIPTCEACWPACSYSITYSLFIPYDQYDKAVAVINGLEQAPK